MAQKTNLNINPYYDDFDSEKNFQKVLFKPGYPVQARELTTSQTILQNQLEQFGTNIFKDGSVVVPGAIAYDNNYASVKLKSSNFGIDISLYIKNFIGKNIIGQTSGVEGQVKFVLLPEEDNRVDEVTIYVSYTTIGNDFNQSVFSDGEELICSENVTYGLTTINAGEVFASLTESDATSIGSAAFITKGVYFVRGYFVNVDEEKIVLDPYTNNSSYRVGLRVDENIITAKDDETLFDNAKGFSNFAAPGADRFQIELSLIKKELSDGDDTDFIELMRIDKGKIKKIESKSDYNLIKDYIADRTFDESGNYTVNPFTVSVHNSLNNGLGNNGLYYPQELTEQQNTPDDDLMCIKISNGRAYVAGYDVDKTGTTVLDIEKPREVGIRSDVSLGYELGNLLKVNTVLGIPNQASVIQLYNNFNGTGDIIGSARVYSFNLEDANYEDDTTVWDLRLFDIQTYTAITLNESVTNSGIRTGSYIKGKNSGASGYSVGAGSNTLINVVQTSGTFHKGEQIEIDGSDDVPRTIGVATAYNTQNIKSVVGTGFTANSVLERFNIPNGIREVTINDNIVRAGGKAFTGLRVGSIVRYQRAGINTETYNKVASISSDGLELTLEAIATDIPGVYDGNLPGVGTTISVSMFVGAPIVRGSGNLFVPLANKNVSKVDLSSSEFKITKIVTGTPSGGSVTISSNDITDISNFSFEPFDAEKYAVSRNNAVGIVTITSSDRAADGSSITLGGLQDTASKISVSLNKKGITSKEKVYDRSRKVTVTFSKNKASGNTNNGNNSLENGLTYNGNHMYGTRVEDEEICLNYPDVAKIIAIHESLDTSAPTFDTLRFDSVLNVTSNAIVGENIKSLDGKIVARVVGKDVTDVVDVVYLTTNRFDVFDMVKFEESNMTGEIKSQTAGKYKDLTNSYTLDKGQRNQYYDYSRIVRNAEKSSPSRQLTIVFDHYTVPSGDTGDAFTVQSYDEERFRTDIPIIGVSPIRASDTIDFRPRVPVYDPATATVSPFHYSSRAFDSSISKFLVPEETIRIGYEFYLPRIDKLLLNKYGKFVYKKGISSESPKSPVNNDESIMEIATINLPPYLFAPQNAIIVQKDNRRYTMRDIGKLEDRISNLEEITSLSLLELDAKSTQILDNERRDRFKTGFFADPFNDYSFINPKSSVEVNPDIGEINPFIIRNVLELQVTPAESTTPEELDYGTNFNLLDSNVRKTGNAVTLNYEEVSWIEQLKATEISNVNPYEQPVSAGSVILTPKTDFWHRTEQSDGGEIHVRGKNQKVKLNNNLEVNDIDLSFTVNTTSESSSTEQERGSGPNTTRTETTNTRNVFTDSATFGAQSIDKARFSDQDTYIRNELVASKDEDFMRSRNTEFKGYGFKKFTQVYAFLDSQTPIIVPKLIDIVTEKNGETNGSVGSFEKGETVEVYDPNTDDIIGTFRLCSPDHKEGPHKNPTETYLSNPSSHGNVELGRSYTSSTPVLNIDTKSLSERAQGKYFGFVKKNSLIKGKKSKASAYVKKNIKLITDDFGDIIGTFFIEDPNSKPTPEVKFNTGSTEFILTTSKTNEQTLPGESSVVRAKATYETGGTRDQWEQTKIIEESKVTITSRTNVSGKVNATLINNNQHTEIIETEYLDPVAQTFVVGGNVEAPSAVNQNDDKDGAFVTAVEVFFKKVDKKHPVRCQIRTVTGDDRPSRFVLAEKQLRPKIAKNGVKIDNILTSDDASVPTKFVFDEPVYLAPGTAYAIVLVAEKSVDYEVWLAKQGKKVVNPESSSTSDDVTERTQYTTQYTLGAFFQSQNGGLWTEDQRKDLTFRLYKAKFTSQTGNVLFNNPVLDRSNDYVKKLNNNPIRTLPKTGKIGIQTSSTPTQLTAGRKIASFDTNKTGTAVITGTGASVTSASVVPGLGGKNYGSGNVETFAITGKGTGLELNITATQSGGVVNGVTIVKGGVGYQKGDVVGIVTTAVGGGAQISINDIGDRNMIFVENIQGDTAFSGSIGNNLFYYNDSGTAIDSTLDVLSVSFDGGLNDGSHLKVNHFNHGMYSSTNKVKLSGVKPNTVPTTIAVDLNDTTTGTVSVADTTGFDKFEGVTVSANNPGYAIIRNREIIKYTSVGTGTLTIATDGRGQEDTEASEHESGDTIIKYELNGVSLRRINNVTHSISSLGLEADSYHIAIDRSTNGINRNADVLSPLESISPQVSFTSDEFVGGNRVLSSENILFNAVVPTFDVITPVGGNNNIVTDVSASMRTTTATSVDGNEPSFVDNGYQNVSLNRYNALRSVRMVASKVNEDEYMTNLPRSKSFTTNLTLSSNSENLSPIIYLNGGSSIEFISNKLNRPIDLEKYASNSLVGTIDEDPHSSVYISQEISLKQPSTSLKVILAANRHESSDFRVAYKLIKQDSTSIEQSFELFPGFKNLNSDGIVIDPAKNDGRPDYYVAPNVNGEYSEYVFSADNLDSFIGYSIKIMMSGSNQAYYPKITDLRTITLA